MNSIFILVALGGYFCFAITSVIDKILLRRVLKEPAAYAMVIGLGSGLVILLAPFGLTWIGGQLLGAALFVGALFVAALWAFFVALARSDATRVVPILGALTAVLTFFGARAFLSEQLDGRAILAIVLLILGLVLLTVGRGGGQPDRAAWISIAVSALLFALMFLAQKALYLQVSFLDGLIWSRMGMVTAGAILALVPRYRRAIITGLQRDPHRKSATLFLAGQAAGASGAVLQQFAIATGSVTIVNALQGTQYTFIFLMMLVIGAINPKLSPERLDRKTLPWRLGGLVAIAIGLILLTNVKS